MTPRRQKPEEKVGESAVDQPLPQGHRRRTGARRSRARELVLLLVAVLAFYLLLIGVRGVSLLGDHRWTVKGLGVGILLLPVVGVAIVAAELRFGRATERLAALLGPDPDPAADDLHPDQAFARRKAQVEASPEDWQAWYRLAVAYGNARDNARGRRAMRRAIALERVAPAPAPEASQLPRKPRIRDSGAP